MSTKTKEVEKKQEKFDYTSIKSFEDACKKLNVDPEKLPDVSNIPSDLSKPIIATYKLMMIYKAINDGWVPDWKDRHEYKYFPWFEVSSSGFGFSFSLYHFAHTYTYVGSRLCTDSSEKALYIAKQFEQEYKNYLLISE